jgi:ATP-binding cassette subfamily F protein 3
MLTVNNLALRRSGEILFENTTFTISQGQRVGLIGANGAGKTSFFRMLLGELDADTGELDLPDDTRIAYLEQEVPASNQLAIDYVLEGDELLSRIHNDIAEVEREGHFEKLAELHERLAAIDGYSARALSQAFPAAGAFASTLPGR